MKEIIVKEAAGKVLKVTQPMGSEGVYHIYVDAWYQGRKISSGAVTPDCTPKKKGGPIPAAAFSVDL